MLPGIYSGEEVGFSVVVGIGCGLGRLESPADEVNKNSGTFFFSFCTFGLKSLLQRSFVYQRGALDSACILNICIEARSTLIALFHAINIFLAGHL